MAVRPASTHYFIEPGTPIRAERGASGPIHLILDADSKLTLTLDWDRNRSTKAGALAQLAEMVAAVEALPDDPEPLPLLHLHDEECFLRGCKTYQNVTAP